jgi:hypothetical protein
LTSATAAIFNFFYFNGTFVTTRAAMADRTPFIHGGGNTFPYWNSAGTLIEASDNSYVVYHYFATPMTGGWAVFSRPHNAQYATLAAAQLARPAQLTWSNYAELKHIHTAVFRTRTQFTNATHRCKLVSLQDFRNVSGGPVTATAATDHNALSNRGAINSHPIAAVYGVINGAIPFHSTSSLGLVESADLAVDATALVNTRFTSLGSAASGAPRIKMKKLTGTTAATEGGVTTIAHGLDSTKILNAKTTVILGGSTGINEHHTLTAGYEFFSYYDNINMIIALHSTNSENILGTPITVLITYEE